MKHFPFCKKYSGEIGLINLLAWLGQAGPSTCPKGSSIWLGNAPDGRGQVKGYWPVFKSSSKQYPLGCRNEYICQKQGPLGCTNNNSRHYYTV